MSLESDKYGKVSLLKTYILVYIFHIICISKTYLDSENSSDGDSLEIQGYNLVRCDRPSNVKRGGVWFYYKHSHKKRKDRLEARAVLLIFLLELEISGVLHRAYIKSAKNSDFY